MSAKELVKAFKKASWNSSQDMELFLASAKAEPIPGEAVVEMLDMLTRKRLAGDPRAHAMRCRAFGELAQGVEDKKLFAYYLKAVKDADSQVRNVITPLMAKVNNYDEHPKLCALLRSPNQELRRAVAAVIKEVGGKTALKVLGELVQERDFPGRNEAMELAMPLGGHHALPILESVLEKGKPEEKARALRYLGDQRYLARAPAAALKTLHPYLDDANERLAGHAIASFCAHCTEDDFFEHVAPLLDSPRIAVVRAAIAGLKLFNSPRVIVELDRKLQAGPHAIRMEVLASLEAIANEDVLPPLVRALSHKNLNLRNRASEVLSALSRSGKIDVARTVMWLLRSSDVNVRRMALELARTIRDPTAELWPKLLAFLRDEDWWVRERVMDAAVEMAGKALTPHMAEYLADPNDVIRRFAVDVLGRIKDPRALGALVQRAKEDTDWWTREKAIEAVATIGDARAAPHLVDIMQTDDEMQLACIAALRDLGDKSSSPYIVALLSASDPDVRFAVLDYLRYFHLPEYAKFVKKAQKDENPEVAQLATALLQTWNIEHEAQAGVSRDQALVFLDRLLLGMADAGGDDLILAPDRTPYMKRMGHVVAAIPTVLSGEQVKSLLVPHLTAAQYDGLQQGEDLDFSYDVQGYNQRFRVNLFMQRGGMAAVFRKINDELPEFETLGLPDVIRSFADLGYGIVLVGGPTGSGKSTTLAALIGYINRTSARHVISLEDPIEVVHGTAKGLVNQREIGTHTPDFAGALRSILRQDPDVLLVGELRDLQTIRFAVEAANTGHLVFGTVHTVSVDSSVDRLINAFPPGEQHLVRSSLAENLRAVVCQHLLKRKDGQGRVAACEVMINNDAISNLIRKGKAFQINSVVATSGDMGMLLMDNELMRLYREKLISADEAYMRATTKSYFEELLNEADDKGPALAALHEGNLDFQGRAAAPDNGDAGHAPIAAGAPHGST
jgi:twitching motility protein PilT